MKLQSIFLSLVLIVGSVNVLKAEDPAAKKPTTLNDALKEAPYTLAIIKSLVEEATKKQLMSFDGDRLVLKNGDCGEELPNNVKIPTVVGKPNYDINNQNVRMSVLLKKHTFDNKRNLKASETARGQDIFLNHVDSQQFRVDFGDNYTDCMVNDGYEDGSLLVGCMCHTNMSELLKNPEAHIAIKAFIKK